MAIKSFLTYYFSYCQNLCTFLLFFKDMGRIMCNNTSVTHRVHFFNMFFWGGGGGINDKLKVRGRTGEFRF